MPFVKNELAAGGIGLLPEEIQPESPAFFGDVLPAAFRRENTVVSALSTPAEARVRPGAQVPDFDPFEDLIGYEPWAGAFVDADRPEEVAAIKARIDSELRDEETLAAAGLLGYAASFAAGFIDPIILVPFGGAAAKGIRLGRSWLWGAAATGRAGLIGSGAAEVALHTRQETRTMGQSAVNVAAATLLSGVLGGAITGLSSSARRAAERAIERDMNPKVAGGMDPHEVPIRAADLEADTAGRFADGPTATEERLKGALGLGKTPIANLTPLLRVALRSPSIVARRVLQQLADVPLFYEKNALGIATPHSVEGRVIGHTARLGQFLEDVERQYVKYRTGKVGGRVKRTALQIKDAIRKPELEILNFKAFREEVGRSARIGDVHPIPEVENLAKLARKRIADPLKDDAIRAGLLDKDVKVETATSYLMRMWNPRKIKQQRDVLLRRTENWLRERHPELSEAQLRDSSDQIIDRLLSRPDGRLAYEAMTFGGKSPLKARTFLIEDDVIEDFLENDIELVMRAYVRTMAPDVELTNTFGDASMSKQISIINDDYNAKIRGAKSKKEREGLDNLRKRDIDDIKAMRDILRGTYAAPADPDALITRSFRAMRHANLLSRGGGFAVAAIPDMGRTVMVHGLTRTIRDGVIPMIRNFKTFRVAANEAKLAGTGWDVVLDTRALSLADLGDEFGRHSKFERGLQSATSNFMLINLLSPWNAAAKQFAGVIVQSRILSATDALRLGRIKPRDLEKLAQVGIDRSMGLRIAKQFDEFGSVDSGARIANTERWTDQGARDSFRQALRKDVDTVIVTPGIGDRPLWMSSEVGKTIGQFKSFAMASTLRVLMLSAQQRDMAALNGILLSTALGMMVYSQKTWQAGKPLADDPVTWIKEGVDRSGVSGMVMDLNNMLEKVNLGASRIIGGPAASRYASRNLLGTLAGPAAGFVGSVGPVLRAAATGEVVRSDVKSLRRLIPYQNLFYLSHLFDNAEEGIAQGLGIPRTRPRRRR